MNKFFYFLMVGLSLIVFQVVEVEAQRGDPRGAHPAPRDTRVAAPKVDTRGPSGAASSVDTRGGGLSKSEMVAACKKQYGKKKKNKAAKQACIAAAKGR